MPDRRYVTDHNVDRFVSLLEKADNDGDRILFSKLLVAEEDRYALEEHARDKIFQCISVVGEKIRLQALRMVEMRERGHDTDLAEALMRNFLLIHGTLINESTRRNLRPRAGED